MLAHKSNLLLVLCEKSSHRICFNDFMFSESSIMENIWVIALLLSKLHSKFKKTGISNIKSSLSTNITSCQICITLSDNSFKSSGSSFWYSLFVLSWRFSALLYLASRCWLFYVFFLYALGKIDGIYAGLWGCFDGLLLTKWSPQIRLLLIGCHNFPLSLKK